MAIGPAGIGRSEAEAIPDGPARSGSRAAAWRAGSGEGRPRSRPSPRVNFCGMKWSKKRAERLSSSTTSSITTSIFPHSTSTTFPLHSSRKKDESTNGIRTGGDRPQRSGGNPCRSGQERVQGGSLARGGCKGAAAQRSPCPGEFRRSDSGVERGRSASLHPPHTTLLVLRI